MIDELGRLTSFQQTGAGATTRDWTLDDARGAVWFRGGKVRVGNRAVPHGSALVHPEMGRFIEQDPIGEGGGLNLYAYVGSSPTMWVDPSGLLPVSRDTLNSMGWRGPRAGSLQARILMRQLARVESAPEAGPSTDVSSEVSKTGATEEPKQSAAPDANTGGADEQETSSEAEAGGESGEMSGNDDVNTIDKSMLLQSSNTQNSGAPGVDVGGSSPQAKTITMALSHQGLDFIKSYETLVLTPYVDGDTTNQTIGYGHKILPGETFTSITAAEAETLLARDAGRFELAVNKSLKVDIPQNQFDALVSLAFNAGPVAVSSTQSTIMREVNAGQTVSALDFLAWGKVSTLSGSRVYCQGLLNRRLDEYEMFAAGDYSRNH